MTRQELLETTESLITSLEGCNEARAVVALLKETKKHLKPLKIYIRYGDVESVQISYRDYAQELERFIDYQVKYKK